MSEEEFWRSTPRKIGTLWKLHSNFQGWEVKSGQSNKEKPVFIDQVPFL